MMKNNKKDKQKKNVCSILILGTFILSLCEHGHSTAMHLSIRNIFLLFLSFKISGP